MGDVRFPWYARKYCRPRRDIFSIDVTIIIIIIIIIISITIINYLNKARHGGHEQLEDDLNGGGGGRP